MLPVFFLSLMLSMPFSLMASTELLLPSFDDEPEQKLIDPSMPAFFELMKQNDNNELVDVDSLSLQGIYQHDNSYRAIVDGKAYVTGDKIGDLNVSKISQNSLLLTDGYDNEFELVLSRPFKTILSKSKDDEMYLASKQQIEAFLSGENTLVTLSSASMHDEYDHITELVANAVSDYLSFQKQLASCTPTIQDITFPATELTSHNQQEIMGWQENKGCLVMHTVGNQKAQCYYNEEQLKSLASETQLNQVKQTLEKLHQYRETYPAKLKYASLVLPPFCQLI